MNKLFKTLPTEVQEQIKSTLSVFSECTVEINDQGVYKVLTCTVIHSGTSSYKHIGKFKKDEIFTPEEQIVNYVNAFRDYPLPQYKGKTDWKALNGEWVVAEMVNGNIVFK